MNYKFSILTILITCNFIACDIPEYEAKYRFESEEISITGIRQFKKNKNNYEIRFDASNLLASMMFSSKFNIENNIVIPKTYDIKIKPKFLKRDQLVIFNEQEGLIQSSGQNPWQTTMMKYDAVFDPLNVQIMIRMFIKSGLNNFVLNILDMQEGGFKEYVFEIKNIEKCIVGEIEYKCRILERSREDTDRIVTYYLAEELDFMFIKIIDSSPDKTNTLELKEILSFG